MKHIKTFKTFILEATEDLSPLQKEYQDYFQELLAKYEVKSPADLDEAKMKEFFNEVSAGWTKGVGKS